MSESFEAERENAERKIKGKGTHKGDLNAAHVITKHTCPASILDSDWT
jgi:hypothetical protein